MKRFLLVCGLFFWFSGARAEGKYEALFSYDEEEINRAFADLIPIEAEFFASPDLADTHAAATDSTDMYVKKPSSKGLSPEGAYYAGCISGCIGTSLGCGVLLGPIAVLAVYLYSDKDKLLTNQALKGCLIGSLCGSAIGLVLYLRYAGFI